MKEYISKDKKSAIRLLKEAEHKLDDCNDYRNPKGELPGHCIATMFSIFEAIVSGIWDELDKEDEQTMEYNNDYTSQLENDINTSIELLELLKTSPHKGGNYKGINYAEIKRTRLLIHELLLRNEG